MYYNKPLFIINQEFSGLIHNLEKLSDILILKDCLIKLEV
jgi:hypothetical protein